MSNEIGIAVYLKTGAVMQFWFEPELAEKAAAYFRDAVSGAGPDVLSFGTPATSAVQSDQVAGFLVCGPREESYAAAVSKAAAALERQAKAMCEGEDWKE